jgi:outer membrane protein
MPFPRALFRMACLLPLPLVAVAGGFDPFSTDALTRPPQAVIPGEDDTRPCQSLDESIPLTLSAVVDAALCSNPQTRESWANARAQAALVGVAESAYLPTLGASATSGRTRSNNVTVDQRSLSASAGLLLFDFGGRSATLENARALLDAANATQDATVQAVFVTAVQAYYQVLATQAAQAAADLSEKSALESFKAADARYQAGAATPADKLQAQTAWSQATLNRIRAEGDARSAQGTLASILGRDANHPVALVSVVDVRPPQAFEQDIQILIDQARLRRPDLRAAEAQARAAQANVSAARATGLPSLSLGINASDQHAQGLPDNRSGTIGITLNIPLFSGFSTVYKTRAAQAQAEAKQAQTEQLRLQVALDVWSAYQSLLTATQSVRSTADLFESADQSERVARGRYQAGVGSILDLLNAQSALASARQQRVQARYAWNVSRVVLAQAVGTLDRDTLAPLNQGSAP